MKKKTLYFVALCAAALLCGCVRELNELPEKPVEKHIPLAPEFIDPSSGVLDMESQTNKLTVNLTVDLSRGILTKGSLGEPLEAEVEFVSYEEGSNPAMPGIAAAGSGDGTKTIMDDVSNIPMQANFLRLDEIKDPDGSAPYNWGYWNTAKVLEAEVVDNPDSSDGLYYRSVSFTPTQAYNIWTYGDDGSEMHNPTDTIFYHSRMVGFHPMICKVPRSESGGAAAVEFGVSAYSPYRASISATEYGVIFERALDGRTDVMMSNMAEGQRWHNKTQAHYADVAQTTPEFNYCFPFGHNEKKPEYANPFFFNHYLSCVRLWAKVDQSQDGEAQQLNLMTWGEIKSVSFLEQPSTVTIALPQRPSSAINITADGKAERDEQGRIWVRKQNLLFGEVQSWADETNLDICPDKMFGETDVVHTEDNYSAKYPISMVDGDMHSLETTYLGYCLVKPCVYEDDDKIIIAIQTAGGIYRATISCRALFGDEPVGLFKAGNIYDITLNLRTKGTFTEFIESEDMSSFKNLSPYDNENKGYKSANCYIVDTKEVADTIAKTRTPGYCFIANVMGNGDIGIFNSGATSFHTSTANIPNIANARLVWESNANQIINVQLQHGYIRFQVTKATPGNAVIAVVDNSDNILWSWHIWITDTPKEYSITRGTGMHAQTYRFMDRNLGATWGDLSGHVPTTNEDIFNSFGLYYQWGRKDPLPGPADLDQNKSSQIATIYDKNAKPTTLMEKNDMGSSIEIGIRNPMDFIICQNSPYYEYNWIATPIDFLWGMKVEGDIKKTIYDPCPFGYRVPSDEIQLLLEDAVQNNGIQEVSGGRGLLLKSAMYLPYAGFIGPERNQNGYEGFLYVGQKGDYTQSAVCSQEDGDVNKYFIGHRLRTYISHVTSWVENNIDGQSSFTFNAPDHYVVAPSGSHRDYTSRWTAGSVRCILDQGYARAGVASISSLTNELTDGGTVQLKISGEINVGELDALTLKIVSNNGSTETIDLRNSGGRFDGTITTTKIDGIFTHSLPNPLKDESGKYVEDYTYTFTLVDKDGKLKDSANCTSTCTVKYNFADLYLNTNETGGDGTRFCTVDPNKNVSKALWPVLNQPAILTAYVNKTAAERCGVDVSKSTVTVTYNDGSADVTKTMTYNGSKITKDNSEYVAFTYDWTNVSTANDNESRKPLLRFKLELTNGQTMSANARAKVYTIKFDATHLNSGSGGSSNWYVFKNVSTGYFITGTGLGNKLIPNPTVTFNSVFFFSASSFKSGTSTYIRPLLDGEYQFYQKENGDLVRKAPVTLTKGSDFSWTLTSCPAIGVWPFEDDSMKNKCILIYRNESNCIFDGEDKSFLSCRLRTSTAKWYFGYYLYKVTGGEAPAN